MVGLTKIYQGQKVQVMGIVNGDEVVVQLPDGSRRPVYRSELSDVPAPEANRPIVTKDAGGEAPPPPADSGSAPTPATDMSTLPPAPPADSGAGQ